MSLLDTLKLIKGIGRNPDITTLAIRYRRLKLENRLLPQTGGTRDDFWKMANRWLTPPQLRDLTANWKPFIDDCIDQDLGVFLVLQADRKRPKELLFIGDVDFQRPARVLGISAKWSDSRQKFE